MESQGANTVRDLFRMRMKNLAQKGLPPLSAWRIFNPKNNYCWKGVNSCGYSFLLEKIAIAEIPKMEVLTNCLSGNFYFFWLRHTAPDLPAKKPELLYVFNRDHYLWRYVFVIGDQHPFGW